MSAFVGCGIPRRMFEICEKKNCKPNMSSILTSSEMKTAVVPLNGKNYPTWKVQCRMALMKEGLWNIVEGTEAAPGRENDRYTKFLARRDRALAIIVLSVEPSLLYLVGDPEHPATIWGQLANQFQKRTWANKLELPHIFFSL